MNTLYSTTITNLNYPYERFQFVTLSFFSGPQNDVFDIKEAIEILKSNSHDTEKLYLFRKLDEAKDDIIQTLKSRKPLMSSSFGYCMSF